MELRARQSRQGNPGREEGVSGNERQAGDGRARRDHTALLQWRREVHRQGRGRAVDEVAGSALRSEAASGGAGPEDVLHERLPATRIVDARVQVIIDRNRGERSSNRWANNASSDTPTPISASECRSAVLDEQSPTRISSPSRASQAITPSCTRATSTRKRASSGAASRTECSGSPT